MRMDWKGYALASAFFAGLTAILGKVGVAGINSNLATFIRTCVILLFSFCWISARGEWQWGNLDRRTLLFLTLSGLATGASWLCYYRALQQGEASRVAPIDKLSVVFSVGLAMVFLHERPSATALAGAALILAGGLVMLSA